jgi:hypothetical protein
LGKLVNPLALYQGDFGQEEWIQLIPDGSLLIIRFGQAKGGRYLVMKRAAAEAAKQRPLETVADALAAAPKPVEANTGDYGFTNTKTATMFTVIIYYREGSDANRTITVPPGQTRYVYDFPAGRHNYMVTYRAQVPIMPFPPGAPTMEQDVIYLRGTIYVEQGKSGVMEIKNAGRAADSFPPSYGVPGRYVTPYYPPRSPSPGVSVNPGGYVAPYYPPRSSSPGVNATRGRYVIPYNQHR